MAQGSFGVVTPFEDIEMAEASTEEKDSTFAMEEEQLKLIEDTTYDEDNQDSDTSYDIDVDMEQVIFNYELDK